MSDKLFYRLLVGIAIAGCVSVAVLVAYTFWLQSDCSIISYIANGR